MGLWKQVLQEGHWFWKENWSTHSSPPSLSSNTRMFLLLCYTNTNLSAATGTTWKKQKKKLKSLKKLFFRHISFPACWIVWLQSTPTRIGRSETAVKINMGNYTALHLRRNNPTCQLHAGGHPVGKQLDRKGPGGPGGHQIEHEPAMHPCSNEGELYSGLHYANHCQ